MGGRHRNARAAVCELEMGRIEESLDAWRTGAHVILLRFLLTKSEISLSFKLFVFQVSYIKEC